jgi:hypothetical protein
MRFPVTPRAMMVSSPPNLTWINCPAVKLLKWPPGRWHFDRDQGQHPAPGITPFNRKGGHAMPIDSILVFAAVLSGLAIVAAVVVRGTVRSLAQHRQLAPRARRRSF